MSRDKESQPRHQTPTPSEQPGDILPTSLRLFDHAGFVPAAPKFAEASRFKSERTAVFSAYIKFFAEAKPRSERLENAIDENDKEYFSIKSSLTCAHAFDRIRRELWEIGVTDDEAVYGFGITCIKLNTAIHQLVLAEAKRREQPIKIASMAAAKAALTVPGYAQDKLKKSIPKEPWWYQYTGHRKGWAAYVVEHANFTVYVNTDEETGQLKPSRIPQTTEGYAYMLGPTEYGSLPDWTTDRRLFKLNVIEALETINDEYNKDRATLAQVNEHHAELQRNKTYIDRLIVDKTIKAFAYTGRRLKEVFPKVETFSDQILAMDLTDNLQQVLDSSGPFTFEKLHSMSLAEAQQDAVSAFLESRERLFSPEILALWLERQLRGKVGKIEDKPSPDFAQVLDLVFTGFVEEKCKMPGERNQSYDQLDQTNYKHLCFKLAPLFEFMPLETLECLQQGIKDPEKSTEGIIWI